MEVANKKLDCSRHYAKLITYLPYISRNANMNIVFLYLNNKIKFKKIKYYHE